VRALVDPALAALGPLEVLNGVGEVYLGAVDAGLVQGPVQDSPGRPDERTPLLVLLIARLLAEKHHRRIRLSLSEHGRRRALVQVAARARGRVLRQFLPGGHGIRLPGPNVPTPIGAFARG